jgi:hypothetical protein
METIMRNILSPAALAAFAAILVAGGVASAQTAGNGNPANASRTGWMSMSEVAAKVEGQGYRVIEIEIDDGAYEVKAVDANGVRVEADLDPSTGEPFRGWRQDD